MAELYHLLQTIESAEFWLRQRAATRTYDAFADIERKATRRCAELLQASSGTLDDATDELLEYNADDADQGQGVRLGAGVAAVGAMGAMGAGLVTASDEGDSFDLDPSSGAGATLTPFGDEPSFVVDDGSGNRELVDDTDVDEQPAFIDETPSFVEETPSFVDETPSFVDETPSFVDETPSFVDTISTTADTSDEDADSTDDDVPDYLKGVEQQPEPAPALPVFEERDEIDVLGGEDADEVLLDLGETATDDEDFDLLSNLPEEEDGNGDDDVTLIEEEDDEDEDENNPQLSAPRVATGPRIAPAPRVAGVAGVAAAGAGGMAGLTAGLYADSNVPTIRETNEPKPRAAAVMINAENNQAKVLGNEEENEPIALGDAEDYGEIESEGGGFTLSVQEYEYDDEPEFEEEEDDEVIIPAAQPARPPGPPQAEIDDTFERAKQAAIEGRMEEGVDLYSDVLDMDIDHANAYVGRGSLHLDLGDYGRAMSDFIIAEELMPTSPEPQIAIGNLYFARKEYRQAISYFDAALGLAPEHAMAYCRRGISYYYRKSYAAAIADLQKAQKLDPDIPNIQTYIGLAQKKAKR